MFVVVLLGTLAYAGMWKFGTEHAAGWRVMDCSRIIGSYPNPNCGAGPWVPDLPLEGRRIERRDIWTRDAYTVVTAQELRAPDYPESDYGFKNLRIKYTGTTWRNAGLLCIPVLASFAVAIRESRHPVQLRPIEAGREG